MAKILFPKKYNSTTYKGKLVTSLKLDKDLEGSACVTLRNSETDLEVIPLWLWYDDVAVWSADYILCDIQQTVGLEVLK